MKEATFWMVMAATGAGPSDDTHIRTHRFRWTARLEAFVRNLFDPIHYVC